MKKDNNILIIANCTWYLYNFRKELLEELNNKGYKLILLSPIDQYSKYLDKYFFKVNKLFLVRGSENLFLEFFTLINIFYYHLKYIKHILRIIRISRNLSQLGGYEK